VADVGRWRSLSLRRRCAAPLEDSTLGADLCCSGRILRSANIVARSRSDIPSRARSGCFMALSDDPWIKEHSIIDPERMHALGAIHVCWTPCERNLLLIFGGVFKIPNRLSWILGHDLGDISISAKISEAMKYIQHHPSLVAVIDNYPSVHDICRQNRNTLSHFVPSGDARDDTSKIKLTKMKGITGRVDEFSSTLVDIRRVAEEIRALMVYSWRIHKALDALSKGQQTELPPLVALPELIAKPPPDVRPESKEPREPSRKERRRSKKERREKHRPSDA
jgi:hypothetical protein